MLIADAGIEFMFASQKRVIAVQTQRKILVGVLGLIALGNEFSGIVRINDKRTGYTGNCITFSISMAVVAVQSPTVFKLMIDRGKDFRTGVFTVSPFCRGIAARRGCKRFERLIVFRVSRYGQIAERRAAGIAETVYFRTDIPLSLRGEVVGENAVERMIVARSVRQVIAAVVADQNSAAAQGIVCI